VNKNNTERKNNAAE